MAQKKTGAPSPAAVMQFDAPAYDSGWVDTVAPAAEVGVEAVTPAVEEPTVEPVAIDAAEAPAPEHKDIGNWVACYWKNIPMWKHKNTGQTLFSAAKVRKLRNQ